MPSVKAGRSGGSTSASASGRRRTLCRKMASKVSASLAGGKPGEPKEALALVTPVSSILRLPPPGFRQIAVERGRTRMCDVRPMRDPLIRQMKQRHDIKAGHQHAIERTDGGDEAGAVARRQHRFDHGVY